MFDQARDLARGLPMADARALGGTASGDGTVEDRAQSSLLALRRILRAAELNGRAVARATGLTVAQLMALRIVEELGEVTPKTLATRAAVAPATATALIEKLVHAGYVHRRQSQADRRRYWVSLTETGQQALRDAPDPLHQRFSEAFSQIPSWEQAMILAALERVAGLVEEDGAREGAVEMLHVGEAIPANPAPLPEG